MTNQAAQTMPEPITVSMCHSSDYAKGWNNCLAAMIAAAPAASGAHPDALPDGTLSKSTAKRLATASVSERARAMVDEVIEAAFGLESAEASRCPGENTDVQKDRLSRARSAIEQALTQQRGGEGK